ncbi:hypothetical protein TI39_contig5817g00015 [Zymoseptoria brevis]|uniref:DNA (cytosine-5-)-methyltransferase n=1 Tax=Zymoseptoria brevis TaxID=1047168 RepID=A0A0F4G9D3_9PEZI|nr:hypothetical protein TI39_contig5817g00015 [Zymoseptoria brevis]
MKRRISGDTIVIKDDEDNIVVGPASRPSKKPELQNGQLRLDILRTGASQSTAILISPEASEQGQDETGQREEDEAEAADQYEVESGEEQTSQTNRDQEVEDHDPRRTPKQRRFRTALTPPATETQPGDEPVARAEPEGTARSGKRRQLRYLSHISNAGPAFPRSAYHGYKPPLQPVNEVEASLDLSAAFFAAAKSANTETPEYATFKLDQFSVYMADGRRASDLVTLEKLRQSNYAEFCFDGILSAGNEKRYVQGVRFEILAISGYGDLGFTDFAGSICIQSKLQLKASALFGHWYQLGTPAPEYRRFYEPFLWLARFGKHFVDYLLSNQQVTLGHFRRRFFKWLTGLYGGDAGFNLWLAESKLEDFRTTIAANVGFLWKECWNIDDKESGLCRHPIWGEVDPYNLTAIPAQPNKELRTIVTPFVYQCFRHMYFGDKLEERMITDRNVLKKSDELKARLQLTPRRASPSAPPVQTLTPRSMSRSESQDGNKAVTVNKGDVVCVAPDVSTKWGFKAHAWYAYVQNVHTRKDRISLDVLWLYEPKDTTLGKAYYPFANELFLSDNCSCGTAALDLDCILDKADVSWYARDPYQQGGHFVRQKFRTVHEQDTYDFVAIQASDFRCQCKDDVPIFDECRSKYAIGDTVLVREWNDDLDEDRLQPAQIIEFDTKKRRVVLRQFLRKSEQQTGAKARPNELVLADVVFDKACDKIIRKCHVRWFRQDQIDSGDIVAPYDRDGTGDFFYLAEDLSATRDGFPPMKEGWNPSVHHGEKMVGMSLFCGGGTFDRGLEEAGLAKFRYAADWNEHALHSHRANVRRPDQMEYFLGSVNDLLARAMAGDPKSNIARPGDVHILAGGSPCPGFSMLQLFKLSEQSKQNASLVASIVSFVDFYVPRYFLLENVVTMTAGLGPNKDQNVFSQIVAALVALGYQVQQFLGDAWSYGSPQQRSRVFIVASAPGLPPLSPIAHSHSHPNMSFRSRALGLSSNGLPFGSRRDEFTAFPHVTPAQACADLPDIGDAQPQLCPQFPDHRTMSLESATNRTRMAAVPTRPHGLGLMQAKLLGLLRGEPSTFCDNVNATRRQENSRMFSRIFPNGLFPTIVTKTAIGDGINGRFMHWSQNRIWTVMEARRAQGYQDWEVLIGSPAQQHKIVGNSVDRKVALVLGLSLRESWEQARLQSSFPRASEIRDEHIEEEMDTEITAEASRPATTTDDEDVEIEGIATSVATGGAREEEEQSRAPMAPSTPQVGLSARLNIQELDNRTAKMLLFIPEEVGDVNSLEGGEF